MVEPRLWYNRPAVDWEEALPIGNGSLGAMVFSGIERERLQLNADTLWSGQPREWDNPKALEILPEVRRLIFDGRYDEADRAVRGMQGVFNQSYLPMADLHIEVAETGDVDDYRRELDLGRAVVSATYTESGNRVGRSVLASFPDDVIAYRIAGEDLRLKLSLTSPLRHEAVATGNGIVLTGRAPSHVEPSYRDVEPAVIYEDGRGMRFETRVAVVTDGRIDKEAAALVISRASEAVLYIAATTSYTNYKRDPADTDVDLGTVTKARLDAAVGKGFDRVLADHIEDHSTLYNRVALDLGGVDRSGQPTDERVAANDHTDTNLISTLFQYGRYLLIACSRAGSQAANLQGIWNQHIRAPWSSNWTININTEMNYWPAEVTNLSECHEPLFDLIEGLSENGRATAKTNYGCSGWVSHHNADIWRQTGPVGDFGNGQPKWANWPMSSGWLCQHLWEHYAFTQDAGFLRDRAWPLMRGATEFYLDWLIEGPDGDLVTAPSTSPENGFTTAEGQSAETSAAATMDLAIISDLFRNCIRTCELLQMDESLKSRVDIALDRLRTPEVGRHGQLQEWWQDWDDPEDEHRHVSHLFGLHPGNQISKETVQLFSAARRSLELRGDGGTGWSMAWKVNFWARLLDGDHALKMIRVMLNLVSGEGARIKGGGVYANLFDAHPPFQIDGNFGVAAGIAEMLLQSHLGRIDLLPALPTSWPVGEVTGLCARGGYVVDIRWASGKLVEARVLSRFGLPVDIGFDGMVRRVDVGQGETMTIRADTA